MFRATRYVRPSTAWAGPRNLRLGAWTFAQGPIRLAAATAVAGLVLGNLVLVYEVTRHDAGPTSQEMTSRRSPDLHQLGAGDLRSALEAVEAEIRADVGRLAVRYRDSNGRSRSQESRGGSGSARDNADAIHTSIGIASGGSSSDTTESHTGAGSAKSSGSSSGRDTSDDSTSGSSDGTSSGSGTAGTGGHADGGTGGGGGGGDASGSGDVSGGGSSGGGGGG